jgi:hypothetical protein
MWSIWNAPSDLDYYGQSGFGGDEPGEEQGEEPEPPEDFEIEELEVGPEPPAEEVDEHRGEQQ